MMEREKFINSVIWPTYNIRALDYMDNGEGYNHRDTYDFQNFNKRDNLAYYKEGSERRMSKRLRKQSGELGAIAFRKGSGESGAGGPSDEFSHDDDLIKNSRKKEYSNGNGSYFEGGGLNSPLQSPGINGVGVLIKEEEEELGDEDEEEKRGEGEVSDQFAVEEPVDGFTHVIRKLETKKSRFGENEFEEVDMKEHKGKMEHSTLAGRVVRVSEVGGMREKNRVLFRGDNDGGGVLKGAGVHQKL